MQVSRRGEDPVVALTRAWDHRYKRLNDAPDDSDEALEPFYQRMDEIALQIFHTPATTPAGIAVKLVLWARQHCGADAGDQSWNREPVENYTELDLDYLPVISALHDLECLAGEARS